MTHSDIYTKFMIEYDKANITSSYPSLTKYEIATILDKAYLALIAQKLTGNNPRRSGFESDIKAIEDIQPLITTSSESQVDSDQNEYTFNLPSDFLYYVSSMVLLNNTKSIVRLVTHADAQQYKETDINYPWVKQPVAYIEDNKINVLVDPSKTGNPTISFTYIKEPQKFAKNDGTTNSDSIQFELNSTMAEELIDLAIIMSTEIVESSRLTTKINTRSLEA